MKRCINIDTQRGYTLVELLLYTAITSVLLLSIFLFLSTFLEARAKSRTVTEVELQGTQAMQFMTAAVRNASHIISPATSTSAASLSVATSSSVATVFDVGTGTLRVAEGSNTPISLTSARVTVSNFTVWNLSTTTSPGTVRLRFTLTYVDTTGRSEFTYSKTFTASASLYQP